VKVVINGLAKSGTIALFFTIKQAMPPDTRHLFEPKRFDAGMRAETNVLAKILIPTGDRVLDFNAITSTTSCIDTRTSSAPTWQC
jgi:hypothetical protein